MQIKKFKDALAKHGTDRCSLGPVKGLDEKELRALAEIDLISKDLVPKTTEEEKVEELVLETSGINVYSRDVKEGNAVATALS